MSESNAGPDDAGDPGLHEWELRTATHALSVQVALVGVALFVVSIGAAALVGFTLAFSRASGGDASTLLPLLPDIAVPLAVSVVGAVLLAALVVLAGWRRRTGEPLLAIWVVPLVAGIALLWTVLSTVARFDVLSAWVWEILISFDFWYLWAVTLSLVGAVVVTLIRRDTTAVGPGNGPAWLGLLTAVAPLLVVAILLARMAT